MQRILITGGTGFLGPHIAQRLIEDEACEHVVIPSTSHRSRVAFESDKISLVDGDVRDYGFVQRLFDKYGFDTVFHLAAISEVRECQDNAKLAFDTNIGGTINILEAARACSNINAIVVSSSYRVYGRSPLPYREEYPLNDKGVYEASKTCADLIARSYFYNYKLPVTITRCSNLYGPGDLNYSRIIPNTIRLALNDESPLVHTGVEKLIREFLYIEDAVDAYLALAKNIDKTAGEAYNVGSGEKISIGELVNKILNIISSSIRIDYRESSYSEITNQYLDSSKIKNDIGWFAKVALTDGLNRTIKHHKEKE